MRTILSALLLVACQQPMPEPFQPSPGAVLLSVLPNEERGVARHIFIISESCRSKYGNPIIVGPRTEPRVGTQVLVSWQLQTVRPMIVEGDPPQPPAPIVALLVSNNPLLSPVLAGAIAPGCALLVNPDYVFSPAPNTWFSYDTERQVATMRWTPVDGTQGMDLFTQLIVLHPDANALGMIASSGLQLHIGVAHP